MGFILTDYITTSLYEIPSFKKSGLVRHGFTTRLGGTGSPPYDTLNLAFHVGDKTDTVIANRDIVCKALGSGLKNMVCVQQVHSANIAVVDTKHVGLGAFSYDSALGETDGLLTNRPGLLLATFYADCVPIFILDTSKKVIGSVHAGWKGTADRIGAAAIQRMREVFGTDPADCLVGIGPSIGKCCYEVGEPVIQAFSGLEWGHEILEFSGRTKARLDLWEANRKIMIQAGVPEENVEIARICTSCNSSILFSYRASNGVTGRMGAFITLSDQPVP